MKVRLQIVGASELAAKLETLERRARNRVLVRSMRRALVVWRRHLRAGIAGLDLDPDAKQRLRRGLKVRARVQRGVLWGRVTMSRHERGFPLWLFLEKGTEERHRAVESRLELTTIERREVFDMRGQKWRKRTTYSALVRRATRTARTGRIKAQPYIQPALDAGAQEFMETLQHQIRDGLRREWDKLKSPSAKS